MHRPNLHRVAVSTLLALTLVGAGPRVLRAQEAEPSEQATTESAAVPGRTLDLSTPRATMREFLVAVEEARQSPQRINDALSCLDLSELSPEDVTTQAPRLAEQLEQVITLKGITLDDIPDTAEGTTYFYLKERKRQIAIARGKDGRWRFTSRSLRDLSALEEELRKAADESKPAAPVEVPVRYRSARATMRTFLDSVNEGNIAAAAECLDLSQIPITTREETGKELAAKLKAVMDRIEFVVFQEIPDDPAAPSYVWYIDDTGRIELARSEGETRTGEWLFTVQTVNSINDLFKAVEDRAVVGGVAGPDFWVAPSLWIRQRVPPALKTKRFLFEQWQWLGMVLSFFLGLIAYRVARALLPYLARGILSLFRARIERDVVVATIVPLSVLGMVATWWLALRVLDLGIQAQAVLWPAMKFLVTTVAVWAAYRLIDLVMAYFATFAAETESKLDDLLVPFITKVLKTVVVAVGLVFIVQSLGFNVGALLAGLGLGGLAFALAAQDTLKNFFGSITVIFDRPFQVGDWVKLGEMQGTVESVGFRSSRVRTFYNSLVTIPNSTLIGATVDNLGARRYRRISCKLAVTYSTTPEQMEAFCEGVREIIRRHPYTRKDYYEVHFNEFGDSSLNILLYCFLEAPDWSTELRERHRLFLAIMRLARQLGVDFAFPTQTIHLVREEADPAPAPEAKKLPDGQAMEDSHGVGRKVAASIVAADLGDPVVVPPPATVQQTPSEISEVRSEK